jgi:hypothetical protein
MKEKARIACPQGLPDFKALEVSMSRTGMIWYMAAALMIAAIMLVMPALSENVTASDTKIITITVGNGTGEANATKTTECGEADCNESEPANDGQNEIAAANANDTESAAKAADGEIDLSGRWRCDDGGTYYITQVGNALVWLGESGDCGRSWAHIGVGKISNDSVEVAWVDIPKASGTQNGSLRLLIASNDSMTALAFSGEFRGGNWTRIGQGIAAKKVALQEPSVSVAGSLNASEQPKNPIKPDKPVRTTKVQQREVVRLPILRK